MIFQLVDEDIACQEIHILTFAPESGNENKLLTTWNWMK